MCFLCVYIGLLTQLVCAGRRPWAIFEFVTIMEGMYVWVCSSSSRYVCNSSRQIGGARWHDVFHGVHSPHLDIIFEHVAASGAEGDHDDICVEDILLINTMFPSSLEECQRGCTSIVSGTSSTST